MLRLVSAAATALFVAILVAIVPTASHGQASSDLEAKIRKLKRDTAKLQAKNEFLKLAIKAQEHKDKGRFSEAEPLLKRALEGLERLSGKEDPQTLTVANSLAVTYHSLNRFGEAEQLFKRVIEARERTLGKDDFTTFSSMQNLAIMYSFGGRLGEAEPLFLRALAGEERTLGKDHNGTLTTLGMLGVLYANQGRFAEAESVFKRALEAQERTLVKDDFPIILTLGHLGDLYASMGRYGEAEPPLKRALEGSERIEGKENAMALALQNSLAFLYNKQGRYNEAEVLYKYVVEAQERKFGKENNSGLFPPLRALAGLYLSQDRLAEAEALIRRPIAGFERMMGKDSPTTNSFVATLAEVYFSQARYGEAEPLYKRVLDANERGYGKEHFQTFIAKRNLANLYLIQNRFAEAEPLAKASMEGLERTLGEDHPQTLESVTIMGTLYQNQFRHDEAEPFYKRALEARERTLGKDNPQTLESAANLAAWYFAKHDWVSAAEFWRRYAAGAVAFIGKRKAETERAKVQFRNVVKGLYRLTPDGGTGGAFEKTHAFVGSGGGVALAGEAFETTQWAQSSEAAKSLAQMAARGAKDDPGLAILAREKQDLNAEWEKRDGLRATALGEAANKRNAKGEAENQARLEAIEKRIAEIDRELAAKFPDYAALAGAAPLPVKEVQAQLRADEALVLLFDTPEFKPAPEETFVWIVTKTDMRWVRSDLGTLALGREVQALRCGLDATTWDDGTQNCASLTTAKPARNANGNIITSTLPFDRERAYTLYRALFGQVEDLIEGKSLIAVPSGPLTQVPFQVLVSKQPQNGDYKSIAWLAREHAISVLPAVSSLKALRRVARPSTAPKPMIGFGNPLLDGDPESASERLRAKRARDPDHQACATPSPVETADASEFHKGVSQLATRGGFADIAFIKGAAPLPETASELCDVARDVHADPSDIYLGARATEREIKKLSAEGKLAQYRIVHFATHGALAGQVSGSAEPGLILTPPDKPSEGDDGYLTASEIAGLKLDADWVILSACNTAAGGAQGAEALSGLARAFIYAQARALLVSHWAVNSAATVKLITGAMSRLAADKSMGRAEAMRRSMLDLIDNGKPYEAHPAYWAPFVVVGEGAR